MIENWLDDRAFVLPSAPVAGNCEAHGGFVVGFYNRIEEDKGIYDFIEAIRLARLVEPAIRGIFFGDGAELERVNEYIEKNSEIAGFIRYGGWLSSTKLKSCDPLIQYYFVLMLRVFPTRSWR